MTRFTLEPSLLSVRRNDIGGAALATVRDLDGSDNDAT